jgi:hypothetical protein
MASISTSKLAVHERASLTGDVPADRTWQYINVQKPGVSGGPANQTVESQLIRNNRNPAGLKLVGPQSALTIPFETQIPTNAADLWWLMLKASIYSGASTAAQSTGSFTWSTTVLTGTTTGFELGDVIEIYDTASPTVKYYARVTSTPSLTMSIDLTKPGTAGAGPFTVRRGVTIKNGSTQKNFAMLRIFQSPSAVTLADDRFELFDKETIDACSFSLTNKGIITGTFNTVGVGSDQIVTSLGALRTSQTGGTFNNAPTTEVVDATNNVPWVNVAGVEYGVQSVSFNWANNSQARSNVGDYVADSISAGDFRGTGQFTAYFDDIAEFNKALLGTASSMYVVMKNSTGSILTLSIPRVRYGNPTLNGSDRDVIASMPFQFEEDASEGIGIRISFFA